MLGQAQEKLIKSELAVCMRWRFCESEFVNAISNRLKVGLTASAGIRMQERLDSIHVR